MKHTNKILLAIMISLVVFGGLTAKTFIAQNQYLQGILASIQNKDSIKVYGEGVAVPFVTINVERRTTNHLPLITGTCSVGDEMAFIVKYDPTYSTDSEVIYKVCDVSPYTLNPTIAIPDGKYKVDVFINPTSEGQM